MTYRQVPQRWRLASQLATLAVTAAIGVSILVTPPKSDAKLTVIETAMSVHAWAFVMIVFGALGFCVESWIAYKNTMPPSALRTVSICHIISMSILSGYGLSALASLIRTGHWYSFAGPLLALYLMLMHWAYVNRRYMDRKDIIRKVIEDDG